MRGVRTNDPKRVFDRLYNRVYFKEKYMSDDIYFDTLDIGWLSMTFLLKGPWV